MPDFFVKESDSVARRVVEAIEEEIPLDAGKPIKLSSRAQLADRYSVSLSTVSAAIKDLQRRKLVHWVPGKGIFSGSGQGKMRVWKAALVGWFSHLSDRAELSDDSYRRYLLHDLISEGAKARFNITVIPNDQQGPLHLDSPLDLDALVGGSVDAVLLKDVAIPKREIPALRKLGIPILCDGTKFSEYGVPSVAYDNLAMTRQIVRIFTAAGHRKIGYVGMETSHAAQNESMRQTFFTSLVDSGLFYDFNAYWRNAPWAEWRSNPTAEYAEKVGYQLGRQMLSLSDRPTAIFAWQAHLAAGIAKAAGELGLSVPRDVSILTDAIEPAATPFSTFIQPHRELARNLLERMRQIAEDPSLYFEDKIEKVFLDQGSIRNQIEQSND